MSEHETKPRYVTNAELKQELDDLKSIVPTRWEVRFLILAAVIASSVLPTADIARAAVGILP